MKCIAYFLFIIYLFGSCGSDNKRDSTPRIEAGSSFIDFEKIDLKGDLIRLSEIAGQGDYVCLLFLFDMNERNRVVYYIEDLQQAYPGMQTVIVSHSFHPDPEIKQFEEDMRSRPGVYWVADSCHYEKSIHYQYRIRGDINYMVLISPDGQVADAKMIRQDTPHYLEQFETLFTAWKENYLTNPDTRFNSHTNAAKELEEYPRLVRMGKGILPFLITKLVYEDNFFALTLYDDLQDDQNLKSDPYGKADQDRAKETVKKFVEFHLGIKKREFASDEEKIIAMKELAEKYGWKDDPDISEEERNQQLLKEDYEITEEFFKMMKNWGEKSEI